MGNYKNSTEPQPYIRELAKYLAINAFSHSVDDPARAGTDPVFLVSEPDEKYALCRNILIVGAGASHNANKEIPLAKPFADSMIEEFNKQFKKHYLNKSLLKHELDFLARAYNLKPDEFETVMLACSHFDKQKVLNKLKSKYDLKHVPNLFFEIVGHLFKHRYIDVIIDFNFDEILGNVIEDEMRSPEYHYILSDGDVDDEWENLMIGHRLKKPIYIKPHGTISHPSSMRFDKEQYFSLPQKIADLLEFLFKAEYKLDKKQGHLDLNIITVGFGMQSIDLNYILKEALKTRDGKANFNLFSFDKTSEIKYYEDLQKVEYFKDIDIINAKSPGSGFISKFNHIQIIPDTAHTINTSDIDITNDGLESLFYRLWASIFKQFSSQKSLRNIRRHLIIAQIFQNKKDAPLRIFMGKDEVNASTKTKSEFYLIAKIYVEFALLLVHADGLINITQLKETSINKYFTLLQQFYAALKSKPIKKMNLTDFIKEFGMIDYKNFAKDTFIYPAIFNLTDPEYHERYEEEVISQLLFLLDQLKKTFQITDFLNQIIFEDDGKIILKEHFNKFGKNPVWQIKSNFQEYDLSKFNSVTYKNLLHTDLRFNKYLLDFFKDDNYNFVLSITKSIHFLNSHINRYNKDHITELFKKNNGNKHMLLLLATSDILDIENIINKNIDAEIQPDNYNIEFYKLHWCLHNQHLHLFIKVEKKKMNVFDKLQQEFSTIKANDNARLQKLNVSLNKLIDFNCGIYYHRRMLSRKTNPIYFKSTEGNKKLVKKDLTELFDVFVNYWARAGTVTKNKASRSSHAVKDLKDFTSYKIKLMRKIYENITKSR